jgi:hypothetical protein
MKKLLVLLVAVMVLAAPVAGFSAPKYKRTLLYDNYVNLCNASSGPFMAAAKWVSEEEGLKDFVDLQIGNVDYGLTLYGKKLDERNYVWIYMELGKVISVELITKE